MIGYHGLTPSSLIKISLPQDAGPNAPDPDSLVQADFKTLYTLQCALRSAGFFDVIPSLAPCPSLKSHCIDWLRHSMTFMYEIRQAELQTLCQRLVKQLEKEVISGDSAADEIIIAWNLLCSVAIENCYRDTGQCHWPH